MQLSTSMSQSTLRRSQQSRSRTSPTVTLASRRLIRLSGKMANGWSLVISIIFIAVFSGVAWIASPKGENQTIWRSTLILSAWSCWLMGAVTFLAQWHPLIRPERSGLRPKYQNGPVQSGNRIY